MKVLIDGYHWFDGPPSARLVLREMATAWRREFMYDDVTVALPRDPRPSEMAELNGMRWIRTHLPLHPLKNMLELSVRALAGRHDAVVAFNYAPLLGHSGVFVHDVLFQSDPEWFTRLERLYFSPIVPAARRASVVFTSSESEAARIAAHNPRLRAAVVTGLGVATALVDAHPAPPADLDVQPGKFLLSVGRLNTRKNLSTALLAAIAAEHISPDCPFVVVGAPDGKAASLDPRITDAVDDGSIRYTGFVSPAHLAWLYRHTARFVYLSLDEGYGLPPLEALWFGAPVLVSDRPVFRELLRGNAQYCEPTDIGSVIAALESPPTVAPEFEFPTWERMVRIMRAEMIQSAPPSVSPLHRMVNAMYWRLRRRTLPEDITVGDLLSFVWERAVQAACGQVRGIRYLRRVGLHFRGRRVRITSARKLTVGDGVVFADDVSIDAGSTYGITLADRVTVARGASIMGSGVRSDPGVGVVIGAGTAVGIHNVIWGQGGVTIGAECLLGPNVTIISENHAFDDVDRPMNRQGHVRAPIVVGDDVWIGAGAVITAGVVIGDGAIVGAGAVVTRDVGPRQIVGGVPATLIRMRQEHPA